MIPDHADLTRPVRSFLRRFDDDLSGLQAVHRSAKGCAAYAYHQKTYTFSVPAAALKAALAQGTPEALWQGDTRYQLSYDRREGRSYAPGDTHPPLREGLVVVLDLRLVAPVHIPVAFEIVQLAPDEGRMAMGYVRGNQSKGLQRLTIHEDDSRTARIMHETWYDSGSYIRDRFLYPPLHERLMDRFYDNLRVLARQQR